MPKVSVITPSFNKKRFVADALDSVLTQSFKDFDYWVIENSNDNDTKVFVQDWVKNRGDSRVRIFDENFTLEQRKAEYPTAVILNKYYDIMQGEYYFYVSDDDYITGDCLEKMVAFLDHSPNYFVCWHSQKTLSVTSDGNASYVNTRYANRIIEKNERPDCQIDGGAIMFRRSCLQELKQPYYPTDYSSAAHCDGLFMNKLCEKWSFHPVPDTLSIHRVTNISTFTSTK